MSDDWVIITHKGCRDGFGAAWVAHHYFKSQNIKTHKFLCADPSNIDDLCTQLDAINNIASKTVISFDVGFTVTDFFKVKKRCPTFMFYDHHVTSYRSFIDHYKIPGAFPEGFNFNNNKSGVMLAWDYFFPMLTPPKLLLYVEDRDLWRFKLPDSRAINNGLFLDNDFDAWDRFITDEHKSLETAKKIGQLLHEKQQTYFQRMLSLGKVVSIDGLRAFVINSTANISEFGEYIYNLKDDDDNSICDYAFMWRFDMIDNKFKVSLRSHKDSNVDVSNIAKKYDGGGHVNASGFAVDDIFEIIKN